MAALLGIPWTPQTALDGQLGAGRASRHGFLLNAKQTGFVTNFQGCYLLNVIDIASAPFQRTSIDADKDPYVIMGVPQYMAIRGSDANAVTAAGFPDASAANDQGILRLTLNDTNTTANAMCLAQENALWIAPTTNYEAVFDIAAWTNRTTTTSGTSWAEFGLVNTVDLATNWVLSAREPGYVNGSSDLPFVELKLIAKAGKFRARFTTGGAISEETVEIPSGKFTASISYNAGATSGSAGFYLSINGKKSSLLQGTVTAAMQVFARVCHSTGYLSATDVPVVLDIDGIAVAVPIPGNQ